MRLEKILRAKDHTDLVYNTSFVSIIYPTFAQFLTIQWQTDKWICARHRAYEAFFIAAIKTDSGARFIGRKFLQKDLFVTSPLPPLTGFQAEAFKHLLVAYLDHVDEPLDIHNLDMLGTYFRNTTTLSDGEFDKVVLRMVKRCLLVGSWTATIPLWTKTSS